MDAYIDKGNLLSLIGQHTDARFYDCMHMMKRKLSLKFTFSKEEIKSSELLMQWAKMMVDGAQGEKIEWSSAYPSPDYELEINGMDTKKLCALYLLDDEESQPIADKLLVSKNGNELEVMQKLWMPNTYFEHSKHFIPNQMKSWNEIEPYIIPFSDMIIADRYILTDKQLLEKNLFSIIRIYSHQIKSCVNIILICKGDEIDYTINVEEDIVDRIKEIVEDVSGYEPNVTVVCPKDIREFVHDRCILTNYRHLQSGDSFNFFNKNGTTRTHGTLLVMESVSIDKSYIIEQYNNNTLPYMQNILDKAINKRQVHGDCKCNFLKFT